MGLEVKSIGKPCARNPHARFDERGWERERGYGMRHRHRTKAAGNSYSLYPSVTAPILDSTLKAWDLSFAENQGWNQKERVLRGESILADMLLVSVNSKILRPAYSAGFPMQSFLARGIRRKWKCNFSDSERRYLNPFEGLVCKLCGPIMPQGPIQFLKVSFKRTYI